MSSHDIKTFDAKFAINQFSGNQSLLLQILQKFTTQYEGFDALLTQSIEQNDTKAAQQQIHTLKGVSGNLGMTALHNACKEFESILSAPLSEEALTHFLDILRQTLNTASNFEVQGDEPEAAEEATSDNSKSVLIEVLKRNEFISDSKMLAYTENLGLSQDKLASLKQAIDNLEYPAAIALLQ